MENQHSKKSPRNRNEVTVSPVMDPQAMHGLVQVKQEFGIKSEEDEVDAIEYTAPSNQLAEIFVPKVEKVEPDDSDDGDEVDNSWELFDRFGYLDSFNSNANTMPKSATEAKPMNTVSSSQSHAYEGNVTALLRSVDNVDNNDGTRTVSDTRLPITTAKKKDAKSKIENAPHRVQPNAMEKKKQQLKCTTCDYVAPWPSILKRHLLKHTGEKPFPCKHCPKRFKKKQSLQSHIKVHVKKGSLNCSICLEVFVTYTELVGHESACKQRRYECHLCKKFTTLLLTNFKYHMRVHSGVRPFKCDLCSIQFTQKSNLKKHLKHHEDPRRRLLKFQCSVCAQNFSEQSEKMVHELDCKRRRYECYLCQSYMTHLKAALQYHMRKQHTGERPFKCNLCMEMYPIKSQLKIHKGRSHKND